jgi:hypothetical protein
MNATNEITENNKLIAEFLNYGVFEYFTNTHKFSRLRNEELKFHSDWNWLMEVVEKIENLDFKGFSFEVRICDKFASITQTGVTEEVISFTTEKTKIEAIYNTCIEFIKWYNTQKF